jgi:hypothetical protein
MVVLLLGLLSALPGKPGTHSIWVDLSKTPINYWRLWSAFCFIFPFAILMGWFFVWWIASAWPADDALQCSGGEWTISRTRWFDTQDKLVARTYPLNQITQLRYAVLAAAKGSTIYGLRFKANGKRQKLLAGLEAPEAGLILSGLKALGADVLDDPNLQKRIKAANEMRGIDTGWMDRSWMDRNQPKQ